MEKRIHQALALWSGGSAGSLSLTPLHGDASARRYVRVQGGFPGAPVVAMILSPEQARFSEEAMKGPAPAELPFINVQRYLERLGLPVPAVHLVEERLGVVLLEDLGDLTLERRLQTADPGQRRELYRRAVDLLLDLQARTAGGREADCVAFTRAFEYDLLRWELDHFLEFLLGADRGVVLAGAQKREVEQGFDRLAGAIAAWPRVFVHRDFQSRNLMLADDRLALIDFQDSLRGPQVYDLVALLRDSYVRLGPELVDSLLDRYLDGCGRLGLDHPGREALLEQFHRVTVQRKLKDAGRFVFIDRVKKNPAFLPYIPASLRYAAEALTHLADMAPCQEALARAVPELER